ncbi:hypothetical protein F5Y15DRAFT_207374 [Xylariaceae sp. FL0016]|nr:hypothetical protein F5Y15DRAFT_207374 [Xylariaceae sp. FL0016]
MAISFFVNWELWQQMTFVLAGAIVLVFCAGLVKLWWMQRFLRKHTILDEEKRARQQEMKRSGLPLGRKVDIPFGVRAIQSGVQVDGIWISRPGTPVEPESPRRASSTTLEVAVDPKGKENARAPSATSLNATTKAAQALVTPKASPTESVFERSSQSEASTEVEHNAQTQHQRPRGSGGRLTNITSNETLDIHGLSQLEGAFSRRQYETYQPATNFPSVHSSISSRNRTAVDHSSSSSDEDNSRPVVHYVPRRPDHNPRASSGLSLASNRPTPVRTYTSGDVHVNTSTRKVNSGFEVLPAGTFSRSNSDADVSNATRSGRSRSRLSRIQKKDRDVSSGRGV